MTITLQLDEVISEQLRRLAAEEKRSEVEIVCAALAAYVQHARPLPKGMGKYHSGQGNVSEHTRDILRQAVQENKWP